MNGLSKKDRILYVISIAALVIGAVLAITGAIIRIVVGFQNPDMTEMRLFLEYPIYSILGVGGCLFMASPMLLLKK